MGILEGLRYVQETRRCVPLEAEPYLAQLFGVPVKHIHEVATFYPFFTQRPNHSICSCSTCSFDSSAE